jgi:4-amino-4-deoxy-L-arabinose transferase-like glycosyltransferase
MAFIRSKYIPLLILTIICIIGFLLRSRMFLFGDLYFLPDQGRDLLLVQEIVEKRDLTLIGGHSGFGGLFHGPLWLYEIVPFYILSGGDPFYSLVPLYLIISIGIIVSTFFVLKKLYGTNVGLVGALLAAFSNEFIITISFTSNAQMMPLLFIFYFYFLVMYLRGHNKYLLFAALTIGLGLHFEAAFAVFLVPLTAITLLVWRRWPSIKLLAAAAGVFLLSISNFILFDLRNNFLLSNSLMKLLSGNVSTAEHTKKYTDIGFRVVDRGYWLLRSFTTTLYNYNSGILQILLFLILTVGLVVLVRKYKLKKSSREEKEIGYFILFIFFVFGFYILYPSELHAHYVQSLTLLALFIVSWCVVKLSSFKAGIVLVGLFLLANTYGGLSYIGRMYFGNQKYETDSNGSLKNLTAVADWIYTDGKGKEFGYFVYDPPIVTYSMDYVMWWRGKSKYNYVAKSEKRNPTYLILNEAPAGDLQAHEFWIRNVIRTSGERVGEKTFVSKTKVLKVVPKEGEAAVDPNYFVNLTFR